MSAFEGFSPALPGFLRDLATNNEKAWFEANRDAYEGLFLNPAKDFVAALGPALQDLHPEIRAEPKVNGAIMRINRDTRFSKDKTPYKTHLSLIFPQGDGKRTARPALYMQINATALRLGAGLLGFSPEQLERWRGAVSDPVRVAPLRSAIADARKAGYDAPGGANYKRVPRGYAADDPNADLLRHDGLFMGIDVPHPPALFSADAISHVVEVWRPARPLQQWLSDHVVD